MKLKAENPDEVHCKHFSLVTHRFRMYRNTVLRLRSCRFCCEKARIDNYRRNWQPEFHRSGSPNRSGDTCSDLRESLRLGKAELHVATEIRVITISRSKRAEIGRERRESIGEDTKGAGERRRGEREYSRFEAELE